MLNNLKQFNLPEVEEKVLKLWKEKQIFQKSLDKNRKKFVFYEGPPTANGRPGIHHILVRSFKDIICRYKTMQGYSVPRRAGWDTHGLPVELEVEKELGLKSKKEIDEYGIAEFNAKCRESVWKYRDEWERMTERTGFWLDMNNPYVTYENSYIESVWGILKQISQRELLYKGHRVVPWCTRCGTALSSHELAQGYKEVTDTSVYVKFKVSAKGGSASGGKGEKLKVGDVSLDGDVYILSWTTTPWTLPGNVALAVGEDMVYSITEKDGETLIAAEDSPLGEELGHAGKKIKGRDLIGLEYEPLFPVKALQKNKKSYKVYSADFVNTEEGTGVVHTAVMYGEDDYELGAKEGLPKHHTVDEAGKFTKDVHELLGMYAKSKKTEEEIINHLDVEGYLLKTEEYLHDYPHCWRCGTALLYYAHDSWFIKMSKLREELISANKGINWVPEHLKEGRFGEWLREVKDWAISRNRYWGTPLPMWKCKKCGKEKILESREDISGVLGSTKNEYYLMRHGESESNVLGVVNHRLETSDKYPLILKGRVVAEKSAKSLKRKKIDVVVASPFLRTKETAEILGEILNVKPEEDSRLHESGLGELDGKSTGSCHAAGPAELQKLYASKPDFESFQSIAERMFSVVRDLEEKYKGKKIVIVSHGDPLWMLEGVMRGMSLDETIRWGYWGFDMSDAYISPGEVRKVPLLSLPRGKDGFCDLHRPYIDDVLFPCEKSGCKGEMGRVEEVIDVWFDSGAMPWAQAHFPFATQKKNVKYRNIDISRSLLYPADYICEAIDQTRGWFYTLLAIGVLLGDGAPYKNALSLGHVLDKKGQKMSKSKGNVVDLWEMTDKYGADVIRWYFYTVNPAGEPKRFDEEDLKKTSRQFFNLLYNSFVFYETYADKSLEVKSEKFPPKADSPRAKKVTNVLDKWILARLEGVRDSVTKNMDSYDIGRGARAIGDFVEDLSRWYIRRSRRRFQKPESQEDYEAASQTLGYVLLEISKLLAPFTPFFSDALYASLGGHAESVHLEDWAKKQKKFANDKLVKDMQETRDRVVSALAKRADAGVSVRQPLAAYSTAVAIPFEDIFKEEVNVEEIKIDSSLPKDSLNDVLDTEITHELRERGLLRELVRAVQGLRRDADLHPNDEIILGIDGDEEILSIAKTYDNELKKDVGAKQIEYVRFKYDAELETKFDAYSVRIGLRKV